MRNGNYWELDLHKELLKYVDKSDLDEYYDYIDYKKNRVILDDKSKTFINKID